ncbi:hypothetical protein KH172YL63_32710 [Bacillus sp. KH172YL63]|nr:hypothetical protein KH172YL63_32710 [Bacillus sp. KH172YL63]
MKLNAEVYRLGLLIGFFSIQEVIIWADTLIEQLDKPPYEIIMLSLSSKDDICTVERKLSEIKGEYDTELLPKIIMGLMNDYLHDKENTGRVIKSLEQLLKYLPSNDDEIESEIHFLSDGYYLAHQNIYGEEQEVLDNLRVFLQQFRGYTCYKGASIVKD